MASITLDVATLDDEELDTVLKDLSANTTTVTTEVVANPGPGGWPEVKFTGSPADIITVVCNYTGVDEVDTQVRETLNLIAFTE